MFFIDFLRERQRGRDRGRERVRGRQQDRKRETEMCERNIDRLLPPPRASKRMKPATWVCP